MIVDTQRRHDAINNGTTTVVVAPRILLAEQLCSEFLEIIDTAHTHVMHVHSGDYIIILQLKQTRFTSLLTLLVLLVRMSSSSLLTTL